MNLQGVITSVLFGSCVIIATQQVNAEEYNRPAKITPAPGPAVSISTWQDKHYMPVRVKDPITLETMLDQFQPDCSRKVEQVQFLQSFRNSEAKRLTSRLKALVTPWRWFTDRDGQRHEYLTGRGDYNWLINQHLMTLKNNCS